jgi:hypothetical protein
MVQISLLKKDITFQIMIRTKRVINKLKEGSLKEAKLIKMRQEAEEVLNLD